MMFLKKILFAFILPVMFLGITGKTYSQEDSKFKRHLIEIYFPTYQFFDGTPLIFGPTIPDEKIPGRRGLSYTFFLKKRMGIHISNEAYVMIFPERTPFSRKPGDVVEKRSSLYSAYLLFPVGKDKDITWMVKGGLRYRRGYEASFEFYSGNRPHGYYNKLRDVGPSIGLQLNKPLWKKLTMGISGSYTYFLYLHDKGMFEQGSPYWYFDRGASRNLIDVTLRLGYRF